MSSRKTYVSKTDVLNKVWVDPRSLQNLLQCVENHGVQESVLETSLLGLAERRTDGEGDDNIIWVLLLAERMLVWFLGNVQWTASAYIRSRPLFPGVICLITEVIRSTAMVLIDMISS